MFLELARISSLILACASIFYYITALLAAARFFSRPRRQAPKNVRIRPVSIMVPLCGADFRAYENYASLCRQNYPEFQIVFGVRDPGDSSIQLVRRLQSDFPQVPIDLAVCQDEIGQNPKVNNLNNMLPVVRHSVLVLLDSDIRVGRDFLETIVAEMQGQGDGDAMVTCLYRAGAAPGLASKLEAIGITSDFAPGVLVAESASGISFAFGAAIAFTKEMLNRIGGFEAIADYLADDYMLGNLARKHGYPVRLSRYVVETVLSRLSLTGFIKHQIRWARGIRACSPWGHTGSILTNGMIFAFLYLLLANFSFFSCSVFLAVIAFRMAAARFVGVYCLGDGILKDCFYLIPLRDLLSFVIWCMALFGRRVEWRGKVFRLSRGGKMEIRKNIQNVI